MEDDYRLTTSWSLNSKNTFAKHLRNLFTKEVLMQQSAPVRFDQIMKHAGEYASQHQRKESNGQNNKNKDKYHSKK